MRLRRVAILGLVAACSSHGSHHASDAATAAPPLARESVRAAAPPPDAAPPTPPPYPAEIRSVKLRRSMPVRMQPDPDAKKYGTIAANTRVAVKSARTGPGCDQRWIEIEPFGWICEEYLEPSKKWPDGIELPRLNRGELVPGSYGKVVADGAVAYKLDGDQLVESRQLAGSVHVRDYGERVVQPEGGKDPITYWNIGHGEYVDAADLHPHVPSPFHGVRLGDDTGMRLPLVFAVDPKRLDRSVPTQRTARGGASGQRVPGRSAHHVLEVARDRGGHPTAFRIGPSQWLPASRARYLEATPPPTGLLPHERWVDVDLDRQALVAYEGSLPVFATLVSTGRKKHPTATGIYRVWIKFAETAMNGQMGDEAPYSVATVPWTQFYARDLALHAAYWHDGFGTVRSHGCVNLSPIDSRWVYFWSDPEVPPGWSMAHGTRERPGSIVRVRSAADPDPPVRGYAKAVHEARAARSTAPEGG